MPVHLEPSREGTTGRRYTGARSGTPSAHFWRNLASFSGSVTGGSSPLVAGSLCKTDSVRSERRKLGTWCGAGSSELVPPLPSSAASSPTALSIPGLDLAGTRPLHPRPRSRRRHPPIPLLEPPRLEHSTPSHTLPLRRSARSSSGAERKRCTPSSASREVPTSWWRGAVNEGRGRRWFTAALEANSVWDGEGSADLAREHWGWVARGRISPDSSTDDLWRRLWSSWRPEEREI